jgi:GH15 family glucan-1,4-alpha-glucosidase
VPRPLVFGNGRTLVLGDRFGVLRDLFWGDPLPWNHLTDGKVSIGVFTDGHFSWIDGGSWAVEMTAERTSLRREDVELEFVDGVSGGTFHREIRVVKAPAGARLFVYSHFNIEESDIGNTALWAPEHGGIVHFKGAIWILVKLTPTADDYACGQIGFGGYEGTGRDAEDGGLSKNAIAQGSVDATQGIAIQSGQTIALTISIGTRLTMPTSEAPRNQVSRHEAILRSHIFDNGAVMAAGDSDIMETNRANYAYCWMRDGAHIVELLNRLGDRKPLMNFLGFCERAYDLELRFFWQKYRLDGAPGATWHAWTKPYPFQEDQTASVLALCGEAPDPPAFARQLADAILNHLDPRTDLPLPSYDLWEERYGTHTYTTVTVICALHAAARLFPNEGFYEAATAVTAALKRRLFDQARGVFFRRLDENGEPDPCVDSSTLHVTIQGVLAPDDPMAIANLSAVEKALWVDTAIGGLARYEDDYYFRRDFALPGNPWIITTLWLAQGHFFAGRSDRAAALLDWATARQTPTGVLPEQVDPHTGEHLSVSPLTWSHAEYIKTATMLGKPF